MDSPLTTIFSFVGSFYGLILPLGIVLSLTLLFIPSMMNTGAKAHAVGESIYCYALKGVSILLMTLGALPTIFSVLAGISFTGRTYVGLLIVFICGGLLFLMHEQMTHGLDKASSAVPSAIYHYTIKIFGNVVALLSALSILLTIITGATEAGWWVLPFVLFFYGLLLSWCTKGDEEMTLFETTPIKKPVVKPAVKATGKKVAIKKKK